MQQRFRLKPICLLVLQALACYAHAAEAEMDASAPAADAVQVVQVMGQGQSRQVQNISRSDLIKVVPGTSPLKSLEKLPGVNFESADPFGAYEWSTRFSIRGFSQTQLGYTLDGIPLGDMSYNSNNGLHISRAISSENIGRVSVSQGAGALGTASTSNLGGTVEFVTLNPSDERATTFSQTLGSDSTSRSFVRFDSGLLDTGSKFYISGTRQRAEKWKGSGAQDADQINTKVIHTFGDHVLSAFLNYSNRKEIDYQDMSLDMVNRLGYNWDNYAPDFQRAVDAGNGKFSKGEKNKYEAYYQASGLRKDILGAVTLDLKLTPSSSLKTSIYHHSNEGEGHWYSPDQATSSSMPIAIRVSEYALGRDGVLSDYSWEFGKHTVNAGFWGERSLFNFSRNYYGVTDARDTNYFHLPNLLYNIYDQQYTTTTTQLYLEDTVLLLDDRLKLNGGFKSPKSTIDSVNLNGPLSSGQVVASKAFLPQAGFNFGIDKNTEIFSSASQNMRAFQAGSGGPFGQIQSNFDAGSANLKPETSVTFDLGMRFKRENLQASVAVYHTDFSNRQLNVATCPGVSNCPTTAVNVGKVETKGLEAIAAWKFARELSWFNSFTFNDSKYQSNYVNNGVTIAVAGKQVVDAPKTMFSTELTYENPTWFARVGGKFTDKRYYSYTNDASVPSFWMGTLAAGYKLKSFAMLKDLSLQLNITNLFDKRYISTVGTNGFPASDPTGSEQTLLTGAPRQAFLSLSGKL